MIPNKTEQRTKLSAQVREGLQQRALANDRSESAELRSAIRVYLRTPADAELRLEPPQEAA
jgi:hypothetical protein